MNRSLVCGILVTIFMRMPLMADVEVKHSIAVQGSKLSEPATEGTLDKAFIRGEMKLAAKSEKGVSGLLHLRLQTDVNETEVIEPQVRQAFFTVPIPYVSSQIGRWYEKYTPGDYFGGYLFDVKPAGSGSFKTNYSVVDGFRVSVPVIEKMQTTVHAAITPQTFSFDETYAMLRISSQPIKQLEMNVGTNLNVISENDDRVHRFSATAQYQIVKGLLLFVEYGIVDLSDASDNSWFLSGFDIPTGGILDLLRAEIEYKQDRTEEYESDIAWMILLAKKVFGTSMDIGCGADPRRLGSEEASDVGAFMRITTKF
ncbi:MAG: hypothetical protein ACLFSB_00290 [Chitinispirillaceae bacterium]